MRQLLKLTSVFLVTLISIVCTAEEYPSKIEVFHNNQTDVVGLEPLKNKNINIQIYNLDAHQNIEQQLEKGLPLNIEKARLIVAKRAKEMEKAGAFEGIFSGPILAARYDLTKLPAVVFNKGTSVIYGVSDIEQAYLLWQEKH